MNRTQSKLEEARFFLTSLDGAVGVLPDFEFYVSAFISSARSVIWVMGSEYRHVEGWQAWYDRMAAPSEMQQFLALANDLRIRSVKRGTPKTSTQVELTLAPGIVTPELEAHLSGLVGQDLDITVQSAAGESEAVVAPGRVSFPAVLGIRHVVGEFPDDDFLEIARQYVAWLDQVVGECVQRFGA